MLPHCRSENAKWRTGWLMPGRDCVPSDVSCANFILGAFKSQAEVPRLCDEHLKTQGLIVRRVAGYQLPNCCALTVAMKAHCRRRGSSRSDSLKATNMPGNYEK